MNYIISSKALSLEIDSECGRLVTVRNTARDLTLISLPPSNAPFRLELAGQEVISEYITFRSTALPNGLRLIWTLPHGLTLRSDILTRGDDILFTMAVLNDGQAVIDRLEYPIISGIGRLGGVGQDELVHSHATGMLFHDPLDLFQPDPENKRRVGMSPYPEGFSGSTMQFMAYYAKDKGGFFIGTEDSRKDLKWFNCRKDGDSLTCSIMHRAPVFQRGGSFTVTYPVVLAPLMKGSWYEAADRYRGWAFHQTWAQPRPRSRWLFEDVGICTFGINARYDRSAWIHAIDRMAGTRVFHILGPNWARWGHDYHNNLPRGRADWFPATFSPENMAVIRQNGDFWAPFEFDLLANHAADYPDPVLESRMVHDDETLGITNPGLVHFPFMCPGTEYWHDLHVERDVKHVSEYGANAIYYDISVSNLLLQCLAKNHNHLPGSGTAIADEFASMYTDTNLAMASAKGTYVPTGTEVISEIFVNIFDFYQARAEGGPYAPFEVQAFRDWLIAGKAEKIPLFTYTFQDRAPLRMDGWARPSHEAGDLFYWTAAQVLLNGGLLELNYEFAPVEDLNGQNEYLAEHYYRYNERHFTFDPQKAAFVGNIAQLRVGTVNHWLAYGHMLPAPRVEAQPVELDYLTYNVFKDDPFYEDRGRMRVPGALATAWEVEGRTIWLTANLLAQEQRVTIDGKEINLAPRQVQVVEP